MLIDIEQDFLERVLANAGLDGYRIQAVILDLKLRYSTNSPRPHSAMSLHEAQDWLAANDREGADYWRAQPLSDDLIAAVGDRLEASGGTSRLTFDAEWQDRFYSKLGDAK